MKMASPQESFTINDILGMLWSRRILIACCTVFGAVLATGIAFVLPKKYEASVLVSPVARGGGGAALQSAIGNLSGLAAMAGVNINGRSRAAIEIATLQSTELTEKYIKDNNLLPILFSSKWDKEAKRWNIGVRIPSVWDGNRFFARSVRDVEKNEKTGLVTVRITWTDPRLAAMWANGLVELANSTLRDRAIRRAKRNIKYLQNRAEATHNIELKQDIYSLMMRVLQKEMVAQGQEEYAFRVIDPAVVPEKAAYPRKILWGLMGLLLSFNLICCYVILNCSKRRASAG